MAMASIPPSYYHASAAIPTANHSDFFNTHAWLQQWITTMVGVEKVPRQNAFSPASMPLRVFLSLFD